MRFETQWIRGLRRGARRVLVVLAAAMAAGCTVPEPPVLRPRDEAAPRSMPAFQEEAGAGAASAGASARASPTPPSADCAGGRRMKVHFYDVGEGLAALVVLPDGRRVLVDAGDDGRRRGCGETCGDSARHLVDRLRADLAGLPIDLVWITHQHSDHIGGAAAVMRAFGAHNYVDNGRDADRPEVRRTHRAAADRGARLQVVDPDHRGVSFAAAPGVRLTAVVPNAWPPSCARDPNDCSIGLRIDFCSSSVLFVGDAEHDEEASIDPLGPVTLLQVAHHGSDTSSTPGFLARARPQYAVVSAGKRDEGMNRAFCHPRALVVRRLTRLLPGPATRTLYAFDGDRRCEGSELSDWSDVVASDRLWATSRDGDVALTTSGDGRFAPEGK